MNLWVSLLVVMIGVLVFISVFWIVYQFLDFLNFEDTKEDEGEKHESICKSEENIDIYIKLELMSFFLFMCIVFLACVVISSIMSRNITVLNFYMPLAIFGLALIALIHGIGVLRNKKRK